MQTYPEEPLARHDHHAHAFRRHELPTEWATLALDDDASGLEDADERDARETLKDLFEDDGYRVQDVREDDGEPLEGRWRGEFAEGCTSAFLAVCDEVITADAKRGAAACLVLGFEYVLDAEHETVIWIPEAWTSLILTGRWDHDITIDWDSDTEPVIGPDAYNRWAAAGPEVSLPRHPGNPSWRPVRVLDPRAGHSRTVETEDARTVETAWLATNRPRAEGDAVYPACAPPLPETIIDEINEASYAWGGACY